MMKSRFVKRDERDTHERWCDAMVKKANRPIRSVREPGRRPQRYSDAELQDLFKKCLTEW